MIKPTNLRIVSKAVNQVRLVWTDNTNQRWNVAYRTHTGPGVWINVAVNTRPTAARPFAVTGLYPGSNYDFQVAAVSSTGKRGPYGNEVTGRTNKGTPDGIWNIFARFNLNDKQLHIKWKNGPVRYTSLSASVSCGGTTGTFTIPAGLQSFPIRRLPRATGCSVRLTPTYAGRTGPVYTQMFDTQ
jgi:hypothetical protein